MGPHGTLCAVAISNIRDGGCLLQGTRSIQRKENDEGILHSLLSSEIALNISVRDSFLITTKSRLPIFANMMAIFNSQVVFALCMNVWG